METPTSPICYPTHQPIRNLPGDMRPREKFMARGPAGVQVEDLLAIVLGNGSQQLSACEIAHEILQRFNGLQGLVRTNFETLRAAKIHGLGEVHALEIAAAVELGLRIAELRQPRHAPVSITEPAIVYSMLAPRSNKATQESFWVLDLDGKNKLIGEPRETTRGLANTTQVHAREIFCDAINRRACAVVFAHNHPSGDPTPSRDDIASTLQLVEASRIIGIPVLDHIVIGLAAETHPGYISMRERGLVKF